MLRRWTAIALVSLALPVMADEGAPGAPPAKEQAGGTATGIKRPTSVKDSKAGGSNERGTEPFYENNGAGGSTSSTSGIGSSAPARGESGSAGAPETDGKSYSGSYRFPHPTYVGEQRSPEERRQDKWKAEQAK